MRKTLYSDQNDVTIDLIVESMSEGMFGIDKNGLCTFINKAATQMLGYTREQCMGKNMHNLIHNYHKNGQDYNENDSPILKTRNSPEGCSVDNEVFWRANGTPIDIHYRSSPIIVNGTTNGAVITFSDISEKKRQEVELVKIMDSSLDVICTIDKFGNFVKVSAAALTTWGYTPDYLTGKPFIELVHPDDREKTKLAVGERMTGKSTTNFENRYIHESGAVVPMAWSSHWDNEAQLLFSVGRNATLRLSMEKTIAESGKKYKNLFENNPLPMVIWDFETLKIIDCNEEALSKYGYTREEFLNLTIKELRPAEEIAHIEASTRTEAVYGQVHQKIWLHKKKNGELMFMDIKGHIIDHEGRRVSLVTANDVTAKLKAEEELKKSEEKYRTLFLNSSIPKWIFDMGSHKILDVNEAAILHYGYSREEFLSMKVEDIRPAEEMPQFLAFNKIFAANKHKSNFGLFTHMKKDGTLIRVDVSITRFMLNDQDCGMAECNDVTDREKALNDLVDKDEKLEISNQRFKYATKATSDAILDWDIVANTIYWGEGYETLFGYKLRGNNEDAAPLLGLIHPEDAERVRSSIREVLGSNQMNWEAEYRYRKADNSYAYVRGKGVVIRNDEGKPIRMVGAMLDISKQKEEENHLKLLNRKLREVSWMQSHIIRAPLSRIMGLIPMLTDPKVDIIERQQVLDYLLLSANELDEVIKNITQTTTLDA